MLLTLVCFLAISMCQLRLTNVRSNTSCSASNLRCVHFQSGSLDIIFWRYGRHAAAYWKHSYLLAQGNVFCSPTKSSLPCCSAARMYAFKAARKASSRCSILIATAFLIAWSSDTSGASPASMAWLEANSQAHSNAARCVSGMSAMTVRY